MALPANPLSACTQCVELTTNGTTWTDFSGWLSVLEPDEWTRDGGNVATFSNDTRTRTSGKLQVVQVRLRGVYEDSTATTDPFHYVWAQHTSTTCAHQLGVRWAPAGCATSSQVFSTATATGHQSEVMGVLPPSGDANSGDPLMWEAVVETDAITKATYA